MIKCHFIDIIKTFAPSEIESFRDFIESPYFNKRKKLIELFDCIKNYYPFFTDTNFSRETVFKKLYPNEKFNYAKINESLSALYKLSMIFLKQTAYENNTIFPSTILREELRKRSLKNIFNTVTLKNSSKEEEQGIDSNLFLSQYFNGIETINYMVIFNKNNKPEKVRKLIEEINKVIVGLTNFYVSEIISLSVGSHNYSLGYSENETNIFKNLHTAKIISQLFELIKPLNKYDFYIRLLNLYFECLQEINNTEKYYQYKEKFFEYQKFMSRDDLEYHFSCLVSYCVVKKKINLYKDEFTKEYLNLYEIMLKKKLFINSKMEFLLKEQYINMLVNYESIKNKEKIKMLMEYIKYTHPDTREDLRMLSNAYYYFLNNSYSKVLEITKRIYINSKIFDEKIIGLEIKSYFEMDSYVECLERINLFKKQIRNNTLIDKKRIQAILFFLNSVIKLIKIKENNVNFDASYLKDSIEKQDGIPSKEWLLEKCYELYEKPKQIYNY